MCGHEVAWLRSKDAIVPADKVGIINRRLAPLKIIVVNRQIRAHDPIAAASPQTVIGYTSLGIGVAVIAFLARVEDTIEVALRRRDAVSLVAKGKAFAVTPLRAGLADLDRCDPVGAR